MAEGARNRRLINHRQLNTGNSPLRRAVPRSNERAYTILAGQARR